MNKYSTVRSILSNHDRVQDNYNNKVSNAKLEGGLRTRGFHKKTSENEVLISVLTVVYNGEQSIENSILSVLNQTYNNVEYIIIDGGSTDGTLDIIKKYADFIDYYISEKDSGIADAWNKGIKLCKGDYIGILNADDMYSHSNLLNLNTYFRQDKDLNIVYYGDCYFTSNGKILRTNFRSFDPLEIVNGIGFAHTTCFISKQMYSKVGLFNLNYKIAVDTEFLLRVYKMGGEFKKANLKSYMSLGGVSDRLFESGQLEYTKALQELNLVESTEIEKRIRFVKKYSFTRKLKGSKVYSSLKSKAKNNLPKVVGIFYSLLPSTKLKQLYLKKFSIALGHGSSIGYPFKISSIGNITIGKNSIISNDCRFDNRTRISIGNNVYIAHNTEMLTSEPDLNSPYFELLLKPIIIEDYVYIQSNVTINPGVTIGKGAVVLSGSSVENNVNEFEIVRGTPAEKVGDRKSSLKYRLDTNFWENQS